MPDSSAIIVSKENEVYLKLDAEANIRRLLSEFFSFEVPGYKFTPQYRSRVWDGRIRLFQYASGRIYLGLLPYIKEFAKKNDCILIYDKGVKEKVNDIPIEYENPITIKRANEVSNEISHLRNINCNASLS